MKGIYGKKSYNQMRGDLGVTMEKRDLGSDILRLLCIFFIIIHHSIVHGIGFSCLKSGNVDGSNFPMWIFLLNALCIVGVNVFFWISGFYVIKRNYLKIIQLVAECFIAAIIWEIIAMTQLSEYSFGIDFFTRVFKAVNDYWFVLVYVCIALLAPYINNMVFALSRKEQITIATTVTLINVVLGFLLDKVGVGNGYTIFQGFNMYILGLVCGANYELIMKYFKKVYFLVLYLVCAMGCGIIAYICYRGGNPTYAWRMYSYNNPVVICYSVLFGMLFVRNAWRENWVLKSLAYVGTGSLVVYLLTDPMYYKNLIFIPLVSWINSDYNELAVVKILVYAGILVLLGGTIGAINNRLIKKWRA